ncbi:hypothetical protein RIF29_34889 [Crotalaria pallida]|uniref:Uncharacterized protein n=1 Tax=Crotalaria pallida TaxID=3830 RepID=A0AAN9E9C9_CROPI
MGIKFDSLDVVGLQRESYRFRVRVIRKWFVPGFLDPEKPMSMELILMDESVITLSLMFFFCSELVASFCEGVDGDEYPPIFKSLVGRKMLFKVANPCAGASHDNEAIKVKGVCDDATIISLYELPGADLPPEDAFPLSTAPPSIDLTCDQTEGFEDDIGHLTSILVSPNSNESISSKILSPATSIGLQTPPANRKRKLDDLYADSYPAPCVTRRQSNKASKK